MPAAMVHGSGGGVLLMMTKLASKQTIKKTQNYKIKCNQSPLPHNHIKLKKTTQNHKQRNNHGNRHPAP